MLKTIKLLKKDSRFKQGKILLSGRFLTNMIKFKKTEHHLKNLLGKATLMATRCSLKQVDFGDQLPDVVLKKMKIRHAECRHTGALGERQCFAALLQNGNKDGFYVATVSNTEVEWFQQIENVPILCGEGSQIVLRQMQLTEEGDQDNGRQGGQQRDVGRDNRH